MSTPSVLYACAAGVAAEIATILLAHPRAPAATFVGIAVTGGLLSILSALEKQP
jgi:uncharacterized membrane protein